MKKSILNALALLALVFATACGADDSVHQAAEQSVEQFKAAGVQEDMKNDALFVAEAASASLLQVQLGEAATGKAVSPEVKGVAEEMVTAHQGILNDLRDMASRSNFVLPTTLGEAHHKVYQEVTDKSGISFDLTYLRRIADQNKNLLDRYEDIAKNGRTMEVKQYASKQVPLLKQHQQILERLEDSLENL